VQTGQPSSKGLASTVHHLELSCMPQLHVLETQLERLQVTAPGSLPVVPGLASFLQTRLSLTGVRADAGIKQASSHSKVLQAPVRWVLP